MGAEKPRERGLDVWREHQNGARMRLQTMVIRQCTFPGTSPDILFSELSVAAAAGAVLALSTLAAVESGFDPFGGAVGSFEPGEKMCREFKIFFCALPRKFSE
jgi:hypothetical protein